MQDINAFYALPSDFNYQYGARLRLVVETEKGRFELQHEATVPELQVLMRRLQKVCNGAKLEDEAPAPAAKPPPPVAPVPAQPPAATATSTAAASAAATTAKVKVAVRRPPAQRNTIAIDNPVADEPFDQEMEFESVRAPTMPVNRPKANTSSPSAPGITAAAAKVASAPGQPGAPLVNAAPSITPVHKREPSVSSTSSTMEDEQIEPALGSQQSTDSFAPPPKLRGKFDTVCFQRTLTESVQSQQAAYPELNTPIFFKYACEFIMREGLRVEGIFRLSGSIEEVAGLRAAADAGQVIAFGKGAPDLGKRAAALGDLLGAFLRELPEPIIPPLCQETMIMNAEGPRDMQIIAMMESIAGLMITHLEPLLTLLHLFWAVTLNHRINSMNATNVSTCMAVNMMRLPEPKTLDPSEIMAMQKANTKIVEILQLLIEEYPRIKENMVKRFPKLTEHETYPVFVVGLACSKEDKAIAAVAKDALGRVWAADSENNSKIFVFNSQTYLLEKEIPTEHDKIFGMLPIGNTMIVGSRSIIQIWDCEKMEVTTEIPSSCICFAYINNQLWCGGSAQIQILDVRTLDEIDCIDYPATGMCQAICIVGNNVWAAHSTGSIVVVSKESFEVIKEIKGSFPPRVTTLIAVNGKVWCPCKDGAIRIYDGESCKPHHRILAHKKPVLHLAKIGNCVWSTSADNTIRLWHGSSCAHITSIEGYLSSNITTMCYVPTSGPEGNRAVWCGGGDGALMVYKSRDATPEEIRTAVQNVPKIKQEIQRRKVMAERQRQLAAQQAAQQAQEDAMDPSDLKRIEKERKKKEKEQEKTQQRQVVLQNLQQQTQVLQQMQMQYQQLQFQFSQVPPHLQAPLAAQMQVQYTAIQHQQQTIMMLQRQYQQFDLKDEKGLNRLKSWTKHQASGLI